MEATPTAEPPAALSLDANPVVIESATLPNESIASSTQLTTSPTQLTAPSATLTASQTQPFSVNVVGKAFPGQVLTAIDQNNAEWRDVSNVDAITALKMREYTPTVSSGVVVAANPRAVISLRSDSQVDRVIKVPDSDTTLVGKDTPDVLLNKTLSYPSNNIDASSLKNVKLPDAKPNAGDVLLAVGENESVWGPPQFLDSKTSIKDVVDNTIELQFDVAGASNSKTVLKTSQTLDRVLILPDISDTLVTRSSEDTLERKTLKLPCIASVNNNGELLLPNGKGTLSSAESDANSVNLVSNVSTDTLLNKTLIMPKIESILVKSTKLDLPSEFPSDTLVGSRSTAVLTNKTLDDPSNRVVANSLRVGDQTFDLMPSPAPASLSPSVVTPASLVPEQEANQSTKTLFFTDKAAVLRDAFKDIPSGEFSISGNKSKLFFDLSGATSSVYIKPNESATNVVSLTLPPASGVLATTSGAEILSNKVLANPSIDAISGLVIPKIGAKLVSDSSVDTLANKTLVSPTIEGKLKVVLPSQPPAQSSQSAQDTKTTELGFPTAPNDVLIGKFTPDELFAKTIVDKSNTISATMLHAVKVDELPADRSKKYVLSLEGESLKWCDHSLTPSVQQAAQAEPAKALLADSPVLMNPKLMLVDAAGVVNTVELPGSDANIEGKITLASTKDLATLQTQLESLSRNLSETQAKQSDLLTKQSELLAKQVEESKPTEPFIPQEPIKQLTFSEELSEELAKRNVVTCEDVQGAKVRLHAGNATLVFPGQGETFMPTGELISVATLQELKNKTLTDASNVLAASQLLARASNGTTSSVEIIGAAPQEGDVLSAINSKAASWVKPSAGNGLSLELKFGSSTTTLLPTSMQNDVILHLPSQSGQLISNVSQDSLENKTLVEPRVQFIVSPVGNKLEVPQEGEYLLSDESRSTLKNKTLDDASNSVTASRIRFAVDEKGSSRVISMRAKQENQSGSVLILRNAELASPNTETSTDSGSQTTEGGKEGQLWAEWGEYKLTDANSTIHSAEEGSSARLGYEIKGKFGQYRIVADEQLEGATTELHLPKSSGVIALSDDITVAANKMMAAIPPRQKIRAGEGVFCEEDGLETKIHRYNSFVSISKSSSDKDDLYHLHVKCDTYEIKNVANGTITVVAPAVRNDIPSHSYARPGDNLTLLVAPESTYGVMLKYDDASGISVSPGGSARLVANMRSWSVMWVYDGKASHSVRENVVSGAHIDLSQTSEKCVMIGNSLNASVESPARFGSLCLGYNSSVASQQGGSVALGSGCRSQGFGVSLGCNSRANNVFNCGVVPAIRRYDGEDDAESFVLFSSSAGRMTTSVINYGPRRAVLKCPSEKYMMFPTEISVINVGSPASTIKFSLGDINNDSKYSESVSLTLLPRQMSRIKVNNPNNTASATSTSGAGVNLNDVSAVNDSLIAYVESVSDAGSFRIVVDMIVIECQ